MFKSCRTSTRVSELVPPQFYYCFSPCCGSGFVRIQISLPDPEPITWIWIPSKNCQQKNKEAMNIGAGGALFMFV